jgi:hypothetical protein
MLAVQRIKRPKQKFSVIEVSAAADEETMVVQGLGSVRLYHRS